jgi:pimeloyl-ACP methyl ester carboxylesterase
VNEGMKKFARGTGMRLQNGNPFPEHQYGRHIRYFQQLQRLDVEGAWQKVSVPTLIVWGEFDWIMGRDESDRAAAILGPKATYVIRRGMNHHFEVFTDARSAFEEKGGRFDEAAAKEIAAWLRARTR